MNALEALSNCLPMDGSGVTPSDVGRALAAVDQLIETARDAAAILQSKAGPMEQETHRRLYAALAAFGGAA